MQAKKGIALTKESNNDMVLYIRQIYTVSKI